MSEIFEKALLDEGVDGPLADLARSIYHQESSSGRNTATSNAGARGGMQMIPSTFSRFADSQWNIDNPNDNARAGIRYLKYLNERAGGDHYLTAAGYYGGEGGMDKARQGIAVADPRNPKAPNTLQYASQVVARTGSPQPASPVVRQDDNLVERLTNAGLGALKQTRPEARGVGGWVGDTVKGIAGGINGLVGTVGDLYGLATGDMDNTLSRMGKDGQQYWDDQKSDYLKSKKAERKEKIDAAGSELGKFGTAAWETITDPALLMDTVADNATSFIPGAVVGKGVQAAKLAGVLAKAERARELSADALKIIQAAKNPSAGIAQAVKAGVLSQETANLMLSQAGNAAVIGSKLGGVVQQAADVSASRYEDDLKKTDEQLAHNPEFIELKAKFGGTAEAGQEAKRILALRAARATFIPAAGISYAANSMVPGGESMERALLGVAQKNPGRTALREIGKDILGESATEIIEEGGGRLAANAISRQFVDPNQSYWDGVGENAGMGAAGGFGFGAVSGAKHGLSVLNKPKLQKEVGPLSAAANAGQTSKVELAPEQAIPESPPPQLPPVQPSGGQPTSPTANLDHIPSASLAAPSPQVDEYKNGVMDSVRGIPPQSQDTSYLTGYERARERVANANGTDVPATINELLTLRQAELKHSKTPVVQDPYAGLPSAPIEIAAPEPTINHESEAEASKSSPGNFEQDLASVDERVKAADQARARESRRQILDHVLNDAAVPDDQKRTAAIRAFIEAGYPNPILQEDDLAYIDDGLRGKQPIHTPNEMDVAGLVPERSSPIVAPAGTNLAKVDAALASGYKLRGRTLVSPKGKPFRLNTDELAHAKAKLADNYKASAVDMAAQEAATSPLNRLTEPSQAQKEAGNYKKAHVHVHGLDISIENPKGSTRSGVDPDGKAWQSTMQHHYGYFKGTVGADGDHIDTFIGENPASDKAYIVDQVDPKSGKFDEHKVMLGFNSQDEAKQAYLANYEPGWNGGTNFSEIQVSDLETWLKEGDTTKPFASLPKRSKPKSSETAKAIADKSEHALSHEVLKQLTVRDMTEQQLHATLTQMPKRARSIERELARRGLDLKSEPSQATQLDLEIVGDVAPEVAETATADEKTSSVQTETQSAAETEPIKVATPLSSESAPGNENNATKLRQLSDIVVRVDFPDELTGEVSSQELSADAALKRLDNRIDVLKNLLHCFRA